MSTLVGVGPRRRPRARRPTSTWRRPPGAGRSCSRRSARGGRRPRRRGRRRGRATRRHRGRPARHRAGATCPPGATATAPRGRHTPPREQEKQGSGARAHITAKKRTPKIVLRTASCRARSSRDRRAFVAIRPGRMLRPEPVIGLVLHKLHPRDEPQPVAGQGEQRKTASRTGLVWRRKENIFQCYCFDPAAAIPSLDWLVALVMDAPRFSASRRIDRNFFSQHAFAGGQT